MEEPKPELKEIKVEMWGGHKFYYDPEAVRQAGTDGEILECLKDWRGVPPYSSVRCAMLAETEDGKKLVKELRRLCEGGRDKGKGEKGRREAQKNKD